MRDAPALGLVFMTLVACSGSDGDGAAQPDAGNVPDAGSSGSAGFSASSGGAGGGGAGGSGGASSGGTSGAGEGGAPSSGDTPMQATLQSLPSVRQEHAVAALAGEVYVIAGFTPNASATAAAYDPALDTWREIEPFPSVAHHANAATVGDRLYVVGFHPGSGFTSADGRVFEYDPATDTWTPKAAMPEGTERGASCVAVLDSKIYVFGGARGGTVTDASVYDPGLDEWRSLPALPEPREHCTAGAIGGKVYIAGGRAGGIAGFQPNAWAFDPVTEEYEAIAPIPTPRGGVAGGVLGGRLIVFGGEGNAAVQPDRIFSNVEAYDPVTDTWEALPEMSIPRHGLGAAVLGDRIYLPGGATSQGLGAVSDHTMFWLE